MAETQDDKDAVQSYMRGFNDSRNKRRHDNSVAPSPKFYNLGYEDGEKDD